MATNPQLSKDWEIVSAPVKRFQKELTVACAIRQFPRPSWNQNVCTVKRRTGWDRSKMVRCKLVLRGYRAPAGRCRESLSAKPDRLPDRMSCLTLSKLK
jgi:hypothetical protein